MLVMAPVGLPSLAQLQVPYLTIVQEEEMDGEHKQEHTTIPAIFLTRDG